MRRTLIALFFVILLPLLAAHAQPPAPVGGDMSNTTTTATGSSTPRKLGDRAADTFNPLDFGAIGDGTSHLLTAGAALLATCPELAAPVETDACAMQAAIDQIAKRPPVAAIPYGTPGGTIRVPAGVALKLGTRSLLINRVSASIGGEDQWSSALLIGANPQFQFGLNNGMGIGAATVASTGSRFVQGDVNILTGLGGVCEDPPILTVLTVGADGDILTSSVSHPGSCSVQPSSPLDYVTSGVGFGASFNGVWQGTGPFTLQTAGVINTTGTGCANGEVLTGVGGTTPAGTPRQFQLTVTNAVAGAIQRNGVSITDPGSYGTPPPNPIRPTASAGCTGSSFNVSAFTNSGGLLDMHNLLMVADGAGVSVAKAQFNMPQRSTILRDLVGRATGTNYFSAGFDVTSMTNALVQNIDFNNNLTYLNSNPSAALFVVRQQNNLLGHFEHHWDKVSASGFMGGGVDYIATATDTVPYQGLKFYRLICGLGAHCLRLENASPRAYGNVRVYDLYATQTLQQIEIKLGLDVRIFDSNFGTGTTRVTSLPSSVDEVVLDSVNQFTIKNSGCVPPLNTIPTVTCFHIMGPSQFGIMQDNTISNPTHIATMTGYLLDASTKLNTERGNIFLGTLTPVVDNGVQNTTVLSPPPGIPCPATGQLVSGSTYQVPDNTNCIFFSGTTIPTLTIQLPVNPGPYQEIKFTSFSTITTITVQPYPGNGQVLGGGMPTTITSGAPFTVKSMSTGTATRWQRM